MRPPCLCWSNNAASMIFIRFGKNKFFFISICLPAYITCIQYCRRVNLFQDKHCVIGYWGQLQSVYQLGGYLSGKMIKVQSLLQLVMKHGIKAVFRSDQNLSMLTPWCEKIVFVYLPASSIIPM